MIIIGADYHPGFQQIALVDTETGDCGEQRLEHCDGAERFYRDLATQGKKVRVGMEASGHTRAFLVGKRHQVYSGAREPALLWNQLREMTSGQNMLTPALNSGQCANLKFMVCLVA